MGYADFHVHSCKSDGVLTEEELIELAIANGIKVMAFTEHNYFMGRKRFEELQKKYEGRIRLVPGVEISCMYTTREGIVKEIHVVALDFDMDKMDFLKDNVSDRKGYLTAMKEKLAEISIYIPDYEEFIKMYPESKHIGRKHVANYLWKQGVMESEDAVFDELIGAFGARRAFVPANQFHRYGTHEDMVQKIVEANGYAIVAHAFYYQFEEEEIHRMLQKHKEYAKELAGMEVLYSKYDEETCARLKALALKYEMVQSCGSDYHTPGRDSLDNQYSAFLWHKMETRKQEIMLLKKFNWI